MAGRILKTNMDLAQRMAAIAAEHTQEHIRVNKSEHSTECVTVSTSTVTKVSNTQID